ncbi:MAG: hypothetical protein D6732_20865 [Methanobacteriota archaeon]|nr:MAG: hypothetical protein D6732_20865 [Euryarchaeota archaeon]
MDTVDDVDKYVAIVMKQIIETAAEDGIITEEEKRLIEEIDFSMKIFRDQLNLALLDGTISQEEKETLLKLKDIIVNNALEVADEDRHISEDEMDILMAFLLSTKIPK